MEPKTLEDKARSILATLQSLFDPNPASPLKVELFNLKRVFSAEESSLGDIHENFFLDGGVCCPSCGVPGFRDRIEKQEKRLHRIKQLEVKLRRTDEVSDRFTTRPSSSGMSGRPTQPSR